MTGVRALIFPEGSAMERLSFIGFTVAFAALSTGVLHAQTLPSPSLTEHSAGPGWAELQHLSDRLEAVEAENRRLQSELGAFGYGPESVVSHAGFSTASAVDGEDFHAETAESSWMQQVGYSWDMGPIQIVPTGYIAADMIASERTFALLGGPLFLLPAVPGNVPDSRFTVTGQQTTLGFSITGPNLGDFASSGVIMFNFFGDRPVQNNPGVFFMLGYAELRNEYLRLWVGQDGDKIGRQITNSPAWTSHKQSGEFGQVRPGFRAEGSIPINDFVETSIYFGLTQQVVLDFIAVPTVAGTDNGWPNVEGRLEIGLGQRSDSGQRPIMLAVGGLVGETRAVDVGGVPVSNVSTTWAVIPEVRVQFGCVGFQGEAFVGEALGTYNGAIGQSLNPMTDEPIYTAGGFGELFCDVSSFVTLAIGYGIDNPRDADLAPMQRSRNETYWVNGIWRMNDQWETRAEIARMRTDYILPNLDSEAMQYLMSVRFKF